MPGYNILADLSFWVRKYYCTPEFAASLIFDSEDDASKQVTVVYHTVSDLLRPGLFAPRNRFFNTTYFSSPTLKKYSQLVQGGIIMKPFNCINIMPLNDHYQKCLRL